MTRSPLLQQIIDSAPDDFAAPAADYRDVRKMFAPFHSHPVSKLLKIEIAEYGGIRCGDYTVEGHTANRDRIALHCHGGALVSTPLDEYHFYAEIIARRTGLRVVMPDYRLAPEHPYPAAHDDCFNAYAGLLQQGADAQNIVLMGESCGALLAIGLMTRAWDEGLPLPRAFVSLTGWFDLSVADTEKQDDPFNDPQWIRNRGRDYSADSMPLDDPRISPAYADLHGLPPLYLQLGQCDTNREGCLKLAANAVRAGVQVTLESWPGMIQGWHGLVNAGVPEAEQAWQAIRSYIEGVFERAKSA